MEQIALDLTSDMKTCSKCEGTWPRAIYHNSKTAKDGKQSYCPSCRKAANMKSNAKFHKTGDTDKPVFTYVIVQQGVYYKLGKTTNPYGRPSSIQTGSPHRQTVIWMEEGDCEQLLHKVFEHRHHDREWFFFPNHSTTATVPHEE